MPNTPSLVVTYVKWLPKVLPAQQGSCAYALVHPVGLAQYTLMHEARMLYSVAPFSCDGSRSLLNAAPYTSTNALFAAVLSDSSPMETSGGTVGVCGCAMCSFQDEMNSVHSVGTADTTSWRNAVHTTLKAVPNCFCKKKYSVRADQWEPQPHLATPPAGCPLCQSERRRWWCWRCVAGCRPLLRCWPAAYIYYMRCC